MRLLWSVYFFLNTPLGLMVSIYLGWFVLAFAYLAFAYLTLAYRGWVYALDLGFDLSLAVL